MKRGWKTYNWWFFCIVAAITAFVILFFISPTTDPDNARYILSAISQGLAAIFALVFTITLVVAQMTRRYTAMDKFIRRCGTILLMLVFGIGIITPLLVLKFGYFYIGVNLSIGIAVFCVFSLIPFLIGVNRALMYEVGVGNLHEDIMGTIESGNDLRASGGIRELYAIYRSAIEDSRDDIVDSVLSSVLIMGSKSIERGFQNSTFEVAGVLKDALEDGVEVGPSTPLLDLEIIQFGIELAKKEELDLSVISITGGLRDWGYNASKKGSVQDLQKAIDGLKRIGMAAVGPNARYWTVHCLWCLGAAVTKYIPEEIAHTLQNLKELERRFDRDHIMSCSEACISDYPNLKPALEEFKRRYESV
jgi:hypothetical protein